MSIAMRLAMLRSPARCKRGAIAVEFALIAPVLAALALGLFEYFAATHQAMQLASAARAGAEYAMSYPSDSAGIEQAVLGSGQLAAAGLSITVSQLCECPDGTSVSCTATCGGNLSNVYVQVALSQPAKSILTASGVMAGYTLNTSATLRVR